MIGVGNPWRGDDAAGLHTARALRPLLPPAVEVLEETGEPTSLLDRFAASDVLWLVDAVRSGAAPGTIHRLDVAAAELPAELFRTSTHHLGLAEAVELARALGRLPRQLAVFGVEGADFSAGEGLSPPVARAVPKVAALIAEEVDACTKRR